MKNVIRYSLSYIQLRLIGVKENFSHFFALQLDKIEFTSKLYEISGKAHPWMVQQKEKWQRLGESDGTS